MKSSSDDSRFSSGFKAHEQARCCDCGKRFRRAIDEDWKIRCIACFKKLKQAESITLSKSASSGLDREFAEHWRLLVQLIHPDKHGGSEAANRATQWLLSVKGRLPREARP